MITHLQPTKYFVFLLLLMVINLQGFSQPVKKIALISDHIAVVELDSIKRLFLPGKGNRFVLETLSLDAVNKTTLSRYAAVWYHRTDTIPFTPGEMGRLSQLKSYVAGGGRLFLSMEAVPLLNKAGWETKPLRLQRDSVLDEGFGRPLGFHAFKQHAVFKNLLGGAYVSKQPMNHAVRKHGFFGNDLPEKGKVIGIDWTYITFHEQNKLLLEYSIAKGKVVAAGAYLYYAAANHNRQHLATFTQNVLAYLTGLTPPGKSYYWNYRDSGFLKTTFRFPPLAPVAATPWNLPKPSLQMTVTKPAGEFYDVVGRRMLWMGKLDYGMEELWIHPYMALRDYEAGIQLAAGDSVFWLRYQTPTVQVTPEYLVRTYRLGGVSLREIYTVSFNHTFGVAHYELWGSKTAQLHIRYASSLRYMWPYSHHATGAIRYGFDAAINSHLISGQNGELNTLVSYSATPTVQAFSTDTARHEVRVRATFPISEKKPLELYVVGSSNSLADAVVTFRKNKDGMSRLFEQSNRYYTKLLDEHVRFETPDTAFNEGYAWALARTDQFVQTTPGLGTALMAGFGTTARGWNGRHAISGRPGYAWYFGRDGEWSAMAMNAYGGFGMVKEQLETLIRFQDLNGKIYHELTSSAVAHYDASDATPLFLVLAAHYLKYSGDVAYINRIWPAIQKAIRFCYSTDTDGDGLIENTNVGHGWIEGGVLFGTHTEFYLAGCWAAALDAMAYMSKATGRDGRTFERESKRVKEIIDTDFWNARGGYFFNGKMQDGSFMDQSTGFATVPGYLNAILDSNKAFQVVKGISSSRFTTDWGIRMLPEDNPKYRGNSYHAGMVWPLYGGWGSIEAFKHGLYKAGYQYLLSNLLVYKDWAPGSIEETLNGDVYKPNGVCSHQCWSQTMVVQPAIEGLLGFDPDAVNNCIGLAPYFPWHWGFAKVRNLRSGNTRLHLYLQRMPDETVYRLEANGAIQVDFAPAFPLQTGVKTVTLNGQPVSYSLMPQADGVRVRIKAKLAKGINTLRFKTTDGFGALPVVTRAQVNQPSKGLKVLEERADSGKLQLTLEGRPATTYRFEVFVSRPVKKLDNAKLIGIKNNVATMEVTTAESSAAYVITNTVLYF